jgi:hypothetical protein
MSLFIFWNSLVVQLEGFMSTAIAEEKEIFLLALSWNDISSCTISLCGNGLGNIIFVIYEQ